MKSKIELLLRLLTGLMLLVFGLNNMFSFMATPDSTPEAGVVFGALMTTQFIMPTVAIVEILVGLSLLSNKYTSLMLVVLVPISYSIVVFHLVFDPAGIIMALFVAVANVILLWNRKVHFKEVLNH
jgi:putative oxidoreductase